MAVLLVDRWLLSLSHTSNLGSFCVNSAVNLDLNPILLFLWQGFYFTRDDVALSKFASFFRHLSEEKHEQAEKLLTFQNRRGGRAVLQDVKVRIGCLLEGEVAGARLPAHRDKANLKADGCLGETGRGVEGILD